jgi:hypothetical protein
MKYLEANCSNISLPTTIAIRDNMIYMYVSMLVKRGRLDWIPMTVF